MSGALKAVAKSAGPPAQHGLSGPAEPRLRAMFEAAAIGICSRRGRILEANAALAGMLGYTQSEVPGIDLRDLHPRNAQAHAALAELEKGERDSFKQEGEYHRKDGSQFWGRIAVSLATPRGAESALLIAVLEDTTEYKHAAEVSREAEKMEVIGRLAGGIAHDLNNLLTGVLLYCDLLADGMEPGTPSLRHVEEIRLAGEQGAALTQQLLAIARKEAPRPRPVQINEVVSSTENLLRRLIGEQIELATVLAPRLPLVQADPAQLRQVLLNLVLNARDAMPQGGRITVQTQARRPINGAPGTVSLLVEDNGCGMDESTRARLFEPFFTTKGAGHGTGLGLATVHRIVQEAKGEIDVKSAVGNGTRFKVLLANNHHFCMQVRSCD